MDNLTRRSVTSNGEWRREAYYQGPPPQESFQKILSELYSGKRWIENISFAISKDPNIWAKIRLDPVIAKSIDMRQHLTAGTNVFWEAPNMPSRALVPYFDGLLSQTRGWRQALLSLTQAIFRGLSFLRMDMNGSLGKFVLEPDEYPRDWWCPVLTHIGANHIRREYEMSEYSTPDGQTYKTPKYYWTTQDVVQNKWFRVEDERNYIKLQYHNDADTLGYGRGLQEAIYYYWFCKTQLMQQMLQGVARFAVPWIGVKYKAEDMSGTSNGTGFDSPEDMSTAYADKLSKMQSGNIFVYDAKHEIHTIDFSGEAARGILNLIEYFDDRLVQLILGSSTPTGGSEGGGSYALAAVQAGSTSSLIRYDREIVEESLLDLRWALWERNRKHFAELKDPQGNILRGFTAPTLRIGREQLDDAEKNLRVIQMVLSAGKPVLARDLYKAANLQMPDEMDEVVMPLGAPGGPGGLQQNPLTGGPTYPMPMAAADGVSMKEGVVSGANFLERCKRYLAESQNQKFAEKVDSGLIRPAGAKRFVGSAKRDTENYINEHLRYLRAINAAS